MKGWNRGHIHILWKIFKWIGAYALWMLGVQLFSLTLITYFTVSPSSRFQDISDIYSANTITCIGFSSVFWLLLHSWFNPISTHSTHSYLTRRHIEKYFFPGFIQGLFMAAGLIFTFLLCGTHRYIGYLIQLEETPLSEYCNIISRIGALICLAYGEGIIFHHKINRFISHHFSFDVSAQLIAVLYCSIKCLQFDLGWMHLVTLYLVSLAFSYYSCHFAKSAGCWAAILILFHPLLSLPIFGNDFSGIFFIKYAPQLNFTHEIVLKGFENINGMTRFFTGGMGGPLASFIFQFFLILSIGRSILFKTRKETHSNT